MLRQEFTKLIGEPIIEKGLGSLQGDNRSFYVDPLEEVFREILNIAADNAILSDDPALELTHEQLNKVMLYADKSPVSKSFYQYFLTTPLSIGLPNLLASSECASATSRKWLCLIMVASREPLSYFITVGMWQRKLAKQ